MHGAHGGPHHQPEMVDAQVFRHQPVLRQHHIIIGVLREFHVQPIAGLGGLAMTDGIGQDNVILCRIQELSRAKKSPGKSALRN